jgi:predicted ATP-binding protein involved in virulence
MMRLDTIRFQNFRCFEDKSFAFAERFNLLVGDNGTGKTSVLHGSSIALGSLFLGFPEPAEPSTLDVDVAQHRTFWNNGKANIQPQYPILIDAEGMLDGKDVAWERQIKRAGGRTTRAFSGRLKQYAHELAEKVNANVPSILPLLGYYGTGRIWKHKKLSEVRTTTPGSRFLGYLNCLDPASDEKRLLEWFKTRELVALQKKQTLPDLEAVRRAIGTCIGEVEEVYWDLEADQLAIRWGGDSVRWFRQLSDGYRNVLGMVADMAERCVTLNPQLGSEAIERTPGVVLIDEIDLHLHPKWQRHIVSDLLRTFPRIQFLATTHSPFIIQSLPPSESVGLINLDDPTANDFADKSVEDISEVVQGIESPSRSQRYQNMMRAAEAYYRALRKADAASPHELEQLKDRLDELASRFSDDPAYHAILKVEREARLGQNGVNDAPR